MEFNVKNLLPDEYVQLSQRTAHNGQSLLDMLDRISQAKNAVLLHAAMGMMTETGEFMDQLKKHVMYGRTLDQINLTEEIGDLMWYIALACSTLGVSLEGIMRNNVEKLQRRYPEKFTEQNALVRDLDAEHEILMRVLGS